MATSKKKPATGDLPVPAVAQPKPLLPYSWAVNVVKLNRSIAFVNAGKKGLKGDELEEAVKERYLELGGLMAEDAPGKKPKKGAKGGVVNMAEDNVGDEDDEEQE